MTCQNSGLAVSCNRRKLQADCTKSLFSQSEAARVAAEVPRVAAADVVITAGVAAALTAETVSLLTLSMRLIGPMLLDLSMRLQALTVYQMSRQHRV